MPRARPPARDIPASIPRYNTLALAVDYIVACLDHQDWSRLSDACAHDYPSDRLAPQLPTHAEYRMTAIRALAADHQETNLAVLCAGMEFPLKGTDWRIGGHEPGWNHVNLTFAQSPQGWVLDEIWMCR